MPISNTINITIHVTSFPTQNIYAGIIIYSPNIGYVGLRASPGNSFYVSYFGVSPSPFGGVEDFINSVESTAWKVLPYWQNGELVVNSTGASVGGQYIV